MATFLDGKHCIFCHVFVFVLVLNVIILWLGKYISKHLMEFCHSNSLFL